MQYHPSEPDQSGRFLDYYIAYWEHDPRYMSANATSPGWRIYIRPAAYLHPDGTEGPVYYFTSWEAAEEAAALHRLRQGD